MDRFSKWKPNDEEAEAVEVEAVLPGRAQRSTVEARPDQAPAIGRHLAPVLRLVTRRGPLTGRAAAMERHDGRVPAAPRPDDIRQPGTGGIIGPGGSTIPAIGVRAGGGTTGTGTTVIGTVGSG